MGVVLAASYEARAYVVRTTMGQRRAKHLRPQAIVVPAGFEAHSERRRPSSGHVVNSAEGVGRDRSA
jgi:nucleotidyltransferase/DNA polymerase involved in DNA repair